MGKRGLAHICEGDRPCPTRKGPTLLELEGPGGAVVQPHLEGLEFRTSVFAN